jgi:hypothetical protein
MTTCLLAGTRKATATAAVPEIALSCALVAFTVTCAGDDGAVKIPLELMVPALADHVTAEVPEPPSVALHCDVSPGAIDAGEQETETDVTVGDCETMGWEELPQPLPHSRTVPAAKAHATLQPRKSLPAFMHGSSRCPGALDDKRIRVPGPWNRLHK